ncbi:MAG TPA: ComF family protein [Polyangia bacterium]
MASTLTRLLWPARCAACAAVSDETEAFCPACSEEVLPLENACVGCALPRDSAGALCGACRSRPFPFQRARAAFVYGGAVADAIVRFKHGRHLGRARLLGGYLVPLLDWALEHRVTRILPVPLHPRRLRQRGFNQSLELLRAADRLRRRAGQRSSLPFDADALVRKRDTPPLGHLPPLGRRHRVADAFAVRDAKKVVRQRILLVDDVMTTGATLAECAETLLRAGAAEVWVAALARAV